MEEVANAPVKQLLHIFEAVLALKFDVDEINILVSEMSFAN